MKRLSAEPNAIPSLKPIVLVPNNTMTANAGHTDSLQRSAQMENSIAKLQTSSDNASSESTWITTKWKF